MTTEKAIKRLNQLINNEDFELMVLKSDIEAISTGITALKVLDFLVNVIPTNEMEKYRDMYNCSIDKNKC
jgi:hypothetical protein